MDDLGFNGTGSRFNTRFGSNTDIVGKQLNDMSYGIQAGLPQPGVGGGQSISFTPGGALFSPETDPAIFGRYQYNQDPPQFQCVVYVDPTAGEENLKYYLKIARGTITATGTGMPFTQGTTGGVFAPNFYNANGSSFIVPTRQRMIFDVAVSPPASRTKGPFAQSKSPWMAYDGKFELKKTDLIYYVTASYFDYDDQLNWYPEDRLVHAHEPWVSIVKGSGIGKNEIFAEGRPAMSLNYLFNYERGDPLIRGLATNGQFPYMLSYGMKVIAIIEWKEDQGMWNVTQQITGPIVFENPFVTITGGADDDPSGPSNANYAAGLANKFADYIFNLNYIGKFSNSTFAGNYDILTAEDWWYDPKDWG
jgi:hypothetical protein